MLPIILAFAAGAALSHHLKTQKTNTVTTGYAKRRFRQSQGSLYPVVAEFTQFGPGMESYYSPYAPYASQYYGTAAAQVASPYYRGYSAQLYQPLQGYEARSGVTGFPRGTIPAGGTSTFVASPLRAQASTYYGRGW